ncbi:MAG: glycerol kinase GlpK [Acidobacteriota bacterium]|nr:MAG: glycerol kinase GlpK [Acidobacteriota bacterium]
MAEFVGAIDQGTTSSRFMVFDHSGNEVARHQLEHEQILPRAGWVEHDPEEILRNTQMTIQTALQKARLTGSDLAAIGITNQRETTVVWNRRNGKPYYNAIVWQDTRTADIVKQLTNRGLGESIRARTGLPPATYFSACKLQWLLENVEGLRSAAEAGEALAGTIDTWLLWNLTGGPRGGLHMTDITNASRMMLMDLRTLDWDDELLSIFSIPRQMLPGILPSSADFGRTTPGSGLSDSVEIRGLLGDQQAATVGQACFLPGQVKNTYGTGNFMLLNTGTEPVPSQAGLLTTACFQLPSSAAVFALEGSIAVTGSAVQWLRDQLGIIEHAAEVENLSNSVEDNGGIYFVPAFSGLFAPYWRPDARGAIVGLSRFANKGHLARATLEAICYQTRDVLEAMQKDSGIQLDVIKVDGGATANDTLMQLQADILGVSVVRPKVAETTSLGAAYAAGLYSGFWEGLDDLGKNWQEDRRWDPVWSNDQREAGYREWQKAVSRTLDWLS